MHPHVNYTLKLFREVGKKAAKFFDDSTEHHTQSDPRYYHNTANFLEALDEKVVEQLEKMFQHTSMYLANNFPDEPLKGDYCVIETIHGVENFIQNIPFFCMVMTNFKDDIAQHAIIYDPLRDEAYSASKGAGAQLNNRRLRVLPNSELQTFYTNKLNPKLPALENVPPRFLGCPLLELCYVAANRGNLAIHAVKNPQLLAAGKLILREAGASFLTVKQDDQNLAIGGELNLIKRALEGSNTDLI